MINFWDKSRGINISLRRMGQSIKSGNRGLKGFDGL